eukprot:12860_6
MEGSLPYLTVSASAWAQSSSSNVCIVVLHRFCWCCRPSSLLWLSFKARHASDIFEVKLFTCFVAGSGSHVTPAMPARASTRSHSHLEFRLGAHTPL